jgi:hypothetical protein
MRKGEGEEEIEVTVELETGKRIHKGDWIQDLGRGGEVGERKEKRNGEGIK